MIIANSTLRVIGTKTPVSISKLGVLRLNARSSIKLRIFKEIRCVEFARCHSTKFWKKADVGPGCYVFRLVSKDLVDNVIPGQLNVNISSGQKFQNNPITKV